MIEAMSSSAKLRRSMLPLVPAGTIVAVSAFSGKARPTVEWDTPRK